jgi:hypothetical protein
VGIMLGCVVHGSMLPAGVHAAQPNAGQLPVFQGLRQCSILSTANSSSSSQQLFALHSSPRRCASWHSCSAYLWAK